jgi:hypothetical protein
MMSGFAIPILQHFLVKFLAKPLHHCCYRCWIFSWAMTHIWANAEYRSQVGATNRLENIDFRYVSVVSLSRLFACKVVDVFSFHLQSFHWFIAPPSRNYFQGDRP